MKLYLVTQRHWNTVGYRVLAVYSSQSRAQEAVELLESSEADGEITYIEQELKE